MKFIPYRKYTLYTRLPIPKAKKLLQEHLDSPKKWLYSSYNSKAYDGEIEGDEFTIFQVSSLRWPKMPDISGRFSTVDGKTTIDVCIKLSKLELGLAACAIGFLLIVFSGTVWSNWSEFHNLKSTFFFGCFFFGSLFLIYAVTTFNILLLASQSQKIPFPTPGSRIVVQPRADATHLVLKDLYIAGKTLVEGNKRLRPLDPFYLLQFVMEDISQLVDVLADDFCEHAVISSSVVEPDDLGYLVQLPRNAVIKRAFLEIDADKGDDIITQLLEVYIQFRTFNDGEFL
jgi:hypothetical protein